MRLLAAAATAASLVVIAGSLLIGAGCSSKDSTPLVAPKTPTDTGTVVEETPPVEDTAPWLTYPPGPYGNTKDATFPPLEMDGYKGGEGGEWTKIRMIDYYDPDGSRGVYAIFYVVSAEWCGPCREEAAKLPGFFTNLYKPRGAAFINGIIENNSHKPADQPTIDRWIKAFHTNFDIALDLDGQSLPPSSGIPRNYVINPRDMKIYKVLEGENPAATSVPGLKVLLDYNGAPAAPTVSDAGTSD